MMLKFLTHKLRTQTLNDQQPYLYKNDDEHDSGTESDGEAEDNDSIMESEAEHSVPASPASSCSPEFAVMNGGACHPPVVPPIAVSPYFQDSALPSDSDHNYDHHSSEEELEVINSHVNLQQQQQHRHHHHHHHHHHHRKHVGNSAAVLAAALCDSAATPTAGASTTPVVSSSTSSTLREPSSSTSSISCSTAATVAIAAATVSETEAVATTCAVQATSSSSSNSVYPEKRKWSQVGTTTPISSEALLLLSPSNSTTGVVSSTLRVESSGSSDEEVQGLMAAMATPVEFRTSPPLDAHKPGHKPVRSLSPPPKLFHYSPTPLTASASASTLEVSPRKRHHRGTRAHHIQRPCLDFEKMQQLKARAVTAWRHSGEHGGGELSVFCW